MINKHTPLLIKSNRTAAMLRFQNTLPAPDASGSSCFNHPRDCRRDRWGRLNSATQGSPLGRSYRDCVGMDSHHSSGGAGRVGLVSCSEYGHLIRLTFLFSPTLSSLQRWPPANDILEGAGRPSRSAIYYVWNFRFRGSPVLRGRCVDCPAHDDGSGQAWPGWRGHA